MCMPAYPQAPITNYVAMELLVFVLLVLFFIVVRARLSVDNPGAMQHMVEDIDSFVSEQSHEVIGHEYERYVGYLTVPRVVYSGGLPDRPDSWIRDRDRDRRRFRWAARWSPGATTTCTAFARMVSATSRISWARYGGWLR